MDLQKQENEKCEFCKYSRIDHILVDDILLDVCLDCGYAKYSAINFGNLIRSKMQHKNMLNSKKVDRVGELDKKSQEIYYEFISYFNFIKWNPIEKEKHKCNFCHNGLVKIACPMLKSFTVYYCEYCGSVFFKIDELDDAMEKLLDRAEKATRWYGFIYLLFD